MATSSARVTAQQAAYVAVTAGEASISVHTEFDNMVLFRFAAALPAPTDEGLNLPGGWSNFNGVTGANLYVKAIKEPALVSVVKS